MGHTAISPPLSLPSIMRGWRRKLAPAPSWKVSQFQLQTGAHLGNFFMV